MHIAIVAFINLDMYALPAMQGVTLYKADLVGLDGKRMPCRTANHNPGGYVDKQSAYGDARQYAELTGWPIIEEDLTQGGDLSNLSAAVIVTDDENNDDKVFFLVSDILANAGVTSDWFAVPQAERYALVHAYAKAQYPADYQVRLAHVTLHPVQPDLIAQLNRGMADQKA